ncbi:hypothetical protein A7A78_13960 [Aequorivita soesokkakensis]|uniref:Thymidylate synthase n=1 Tax=Aequorivita soesokkakensis TaxID=1385699 RepID=A0A1A9LDI2_9FLAO|nr:hypothetical protein [Aequorivita soesokkakensis]OAD90811.1 hypothetical protein A7A78_13960 [Aequorivita soesokkakensis]
MKKSYNTPYGLMECYENYLVFHLASDGVTGEASKEILSFAMKHYVNRKYVFIASRKFASPISPSAYKAINPKYMVGLAIVSESDAVKKEAYNEQGLFNGAFSYFKTIAEAEDWANTVVRKS